MLEWLIIGGGIHGTHLAHVLLNRCGVARSDLAILDPNNQLLTSWTRRTTNTGMRYLRSPRVHHLDLEPFALERFANSKGYDAPSNWIAPYYRPAYELFQVHTNHIIKTHQLEQQHIIGRACALVRERQVWRIDTDSHSLYAKSVVLALGNTHLKIPAWAIPYYPHDGRVQHVLDLRFKRENLSPASRVLVVGSGISAGQLALSLMGGHEVTLLSRESLRHVDFDSSPCWLGPACLKAFAQADHERRRWMIGEARQRGTLAQDVYADVGQALEDGQMRFCLGDIAKVTEGANGVLQVHLHDRSTFSVDNIVLATGFEAKSPAQTWLKPTVEGHRLPVARCGYPILNESLRWSDGLYVTGALAELEVGPASANIFGARAGADRITRCLTAYCKYAH